MSSSLNFGPFIFGFMLRPWGCFDWAFLWMTVPLLTHLSLSLWEPSQLLPSNSASHRERQTATSMSGLAQRRSSVTCCSALAWWRGTLPKITASTLTTLTPPDLQQRTAFLPLTVQPKGSPLQRFPKNGPCADTRMPDQDSQYTDIAALCGQLCSLGQRSKFAESQLLTWEKPIKKSLYNNKTMSKTGFWPFQLKSGHHRYGSYEHIVKALVIKTNQLSRRRRGPCTQ